MTDQSFLFPGMEPKKKVKHHCHWPSCEKTVAPRLWGCKTHWYTLPKPIRDAIWATYVPGQEIRKDPSEQYIKVAQMAQEWALNYEKTYGVVPG